MNQYDLISTLKINLEMISNFYSLEKSNRNVGVISSLIKSIINKVDCKSRFVKQKQEERSKLLILKQIKAMSIRNNEEFLTKCIKEIQSNEEAMKVKSAEIENKNKKLTEFETYIQRSASKSSTRKFDGFKMINFVSQNFMLSTNLKNLLEEVRRLKERNILKIESNKEILLAELQRALNKDSSNSSINVKAQLSSNLNISIQETTVPQVLPAKAEVKKARKNIFSRKNDKSKQKTKSKQNPMAVVFDKNAALMAASGTIAFKGKQSRWYIPKLFTKKQRNANNKMTNKNSQSFLSESKKRKEDTKHGTTEISTAYTNIMSLNKEDTVVLSIKLSNKSFKAEDEYLSAVQGGSSFLETLERLNDNQSMQSPNEITIIKESGEETED